MQRHPLISTLTPTPVIEADGCDLVREVEADSVFIAAGQRLSFLVSMTQSPSKEYVVRGSIRKDLLVANKNDGVNIKFRNALFTEVTGLLKYVDSDFHQDIATTEHFPFTKTVRRAPPINSPRHY